MRHIKYIVAIFILGLMLIGCGSSKISYEVTKDIYLNESKDDVKKVFEDNNLDITDTTNGQNAFVVDYKSYSGSESPNSEEDFFKYFVDWKPNWACYDFDDKDRLQSVEYTFIHWGTDGTDEFFQIAKEYGVNDIDHKEYYTGEKIKIESGVYIKFDWDNSDERGYITIGLD